MALRWCLDHDAVTTIIPGAREPRKAEANAASSDLQPRCERHTQGAARVLEKGREASVRGPD